MDLPVLIGIAAFIILGIMFALLRASSSRDEAEDAVTREIIIRAATGSIEVHAELTDPEPTQEEED